MKEFVRREVRAQGTAGIIISNAGTSSPLMIVFKAGLFLGAIYGLLRATGGGWGQVEGVGPLMVGMLMLAWVVLMDGNHAA